MKKQFLLLLIFTLFFSCAPAEEIKKDAVETEVSEAELPHVVAIMPFTNDTQEIGIANQVRKTFYNHFSSKPYGGVKLQVIDEKIVQLEKSTGKTIF